MDEPLPRGLRLALNFLIVAFLSLQTAAITRTHLLHDDRFGFVMFHQFVSYRLRYSWVMADGEREAFAPKRWVRGYGKKFNGEKGYTLVFGIGTLKSLTVNYMEWLHDHARPDEAVGVEASMIYRINGEKPAQRETLVWPPVEGD